VAYQQHNRRGRIRCAATAKISCDTFPQIFVCGEFIGGCTDLFDGIKDGSLLTRFDQLAIARNKSVDTDPYNVLAARLVAR